MTNIKFQAIRECINIIDELDAENEFSPDHIYLAMKWRDEDAALDSLVEQIFQPIPHRYLAFDQEQLNKRGIVEAAEALGNLSRERYNMLRLGIVAIELCDLEKKMFSLVTEEKREWAIPGSPTAKLEGDLQSK